MQPTLRDRIRCAVNRGDWRTALRLAASIAHDLGDYGPAIARAHEAGWHPDFARQLGRDPSHVIDQGIAALHECFDLSGETMPTTPKKAPRKRQGSPRSARKAPTATNPEVEADAPPGPLPAPLALSREQWDDTKLWTRTGKGEWELVVDGARILTSHDREANSWACSIERGGVRGEAAGKGYRAVTMAALEQFNQNEGNR